MKSSRYQLLSYGILCLCIGISLLCGNVYGQFEIDCESVEMIPLQECYVLEDIHESLQGDQRTSANNRGVVGDVTTREGVTVAQRDGASHVIGLNLSNQGLIGQVPSSFSTLEYLEVVDFSNNSITGLPQDIGNLNTLKYLDISNSSISILPESFGSLSMLSTLNIGSTLITELPTMSGLISLDQFICTYSSLQILPGSLMELPDLNSIDCRRSDVSVVEGMISSVQSLLLSSTLIEEFGPIALPAIVTLFIDETPLDTIEIDGILPLLNHLDLGETALSSIDSLLGKMPGLQYLMMDRAALTTLGDLSVMSLLKELRMHSNQLTTLPEGIDQLDDLTVLLLWDNQIQGMLPDSYAGLTGLEYIYLNSNLFDRTADHTIKKSSILQQWSQSLGYRYGDSNQGDTTKPTLSIESEIPFFTTGTMLTIDISVYENSYLVDQGGNPLQLTRSGSTMCTTLGARSLAENGTHSLSYSLGTGIYSNCELVLNDHANNQTVLPAGSRVAGDEMSDVCLHPDLTVSISECEALVQLYYETGGDDWFNNEGWFQSPDIDTRYGVDVALGHVSGLYLHKTSSGDGHGYGEPWGGNNLVGGFPDSLKSLTHLQHLNLSNNRFTGPLLEDRTGFSSLETLITKNNRLSGILPESLGSLSSLRVLDLSDNMFDGEIPVSFQGLGVLEVLNLQDNILSGMLGAWIGTVEGLRVLDLSNNLITGELPSSMGSLNALEIVRLSANRFIGEIPAVWTNIVPNILFIDNNALSRDISRRPRMSQSVRSRWNSLQSNANHNQDDIVPPILGMVDQVVNRKQSGTVEYRVNVHEESYVLDVYGEGMQVVFSGSNSCLQLVASPVTIGSGEVIVEITAPSDDWYEGCELAIQDHGDNLSNSILLPNFTTYQGVQAICYDPELTISQASCEELIGLYDSTAGESWHDSTGRGVDPTVQNWYGIKGDIDAGTITGLMLSGNALVGDISLDMMLFSDLKILDLSYNSLPNVSLQTSGVHALEALHLTSSAVTSSVLSQIGVFTDLKILDSSNNLLVDSFPGSLGLLTQLQYLDLSGNQIVGALDGFVGRDELEYFDVSHNSVVGTLEDDLLAGVSLTYVDISNNAMDRDIFHKTKLTAYGSGRIVGLEGYDGSGQEDITPPVIVSAEHPQVVSGVLPVTIDMQEESYAVSGDGEGMSVAITGHGLCSSIQVSQQVTWGIGTGVLHLGVVFEGEYVGCILRVTDHGGNEGTYPLQSFNSTITCGNGTIEEGEACDEGKSCEDGRDCTQDPGICPSECSVRFVDSCNTYCQESFCGDGYVDENGVDNILSTFDDEQCDGGMYCSDTGEDCTNNQSVCPQTCSRQVTGECTADCKLLTCGDGFVDIAGSDGEVYTYDVGEEACDDGNSTNGDGCNSLCQVEYCGDGYHDIDGRDNDFGSALAEGCDEGPSNGIAGGACSSSCETVGETCYGCREGCESGGTGNHVTFLVFDVSGSMNGHNRKENAQQAHHRFIDLLPDSFLDTNGNIVSGSIAGLATFNNGGEILVSPTEIDAFLHDEIDALDAGGTTNYATVLMLIDDMLDTYDVSSEFHIVLLSDGEPTQPGGKKNAKDAAIDAATDLKNQGVEIFSVGLQQSQNGMDLLNTLASGPQYVYEDPDNNRLNQIYEEIYGSIHCDCFNEQICPECGNAEQELGEECDEGRRCDDEMTIECTNDASLCPSSCLPRFSQLCSNSCVYTYCGDTVVQYPNNQQSILELCDDGNTLSGDGCDALCQIESCGDGVVDIDGADQKYNTADDEQCDDGFSNADDARCMLDCSWNPDFLGDAGVCGITQPLYNQLGDGSILTDATPGLCETGDLIDFTYYPGVQVRGRTCQGVQGAQDAQCEVKEFWCGDGTIDEDAGEVCDDGNQIDGDGCDSSCALEPILMQYIEHGEWCHENSTSLIVQSNEIVPLTWSLAMAGGIDPTAQGCEDLESGKSIPGKLIQCEIRIGQNQTVVVPCLGWSNGSPGLLQDVVSDYTRDPTKTIGGTVLGSLSAGRYALAIENISYTYCDTDRNGIARTHSGQQVGSVCELPLTVVDAYRIEKGSTLTTAQEADAMQLISESGEMLIDTATYEKVAKLQSAMNVKNLLALFMQEFIDENRWSSMLSMLPFGSSQSVKKALTDRLYFFTGTPTRRSIRINDHFLTDPENSFSLVVENADLVVEGSLVGNGMYIVQGGTITFESQNCDMTDSVEGIFITDEGFTTAPTINTDPFAGSWCKGGNIIINGLFIGSGIDSEFVEKRRAQLDLRGLEEAITGVSPDLLEQYRLEQSIKLIEGPSVRMDSSPLAWSELPPGVRELFEVIEVRK